MDATIAARPRPPAPLPLRRLLSRRAFVRASRRDAIAVWREEHFEQMVAPLHPDFEDVVVCNHPDIIKHILVDNPANYPKDPFQLSVLSRGFDGALLTASGPDWQRTRRLVSGEFSPRRLSAFAPSMCARAQALADDWATSGNRDRAVDIAAAMARLAFDIVDETLFSNALRGRADTFLRAIEAYSDAQGGSKAEPALHAARDALSEVVDQRRRRLALDRQAPQDLLTLLITAGPDGVDNSSSEAPTLSNILFFVAASHETTASALAWATYLLFSTPDILAAVRAEVQHAADEGAAPGGWADTMTLTRAVAEESLRLYPSAPLLSRSAIASETVAGFYFPAGSRILIAPWILHRHRKLWTLPDHFVPERFLPEHAHEAPKYAYLPFGAGPRTCLGSRFAIQEMVIVLATIAGNCALRYAGADEPAPEQRITLRARGGIPMTVGPR